MSDVQRLLEQITLSYEAARRALHSPSIMAPHAFINRRMEEIEIGRDTIARLVGDEFQATDMVVRTLALVEERTE